MANSSFNFRYALTVVDTGVTTLELPILEYKDASGNEMTIYGDEVITSLVQRLHTELFSTFAEPYTKKTYAAKTLVNHFNKLYYNPNAINTAENWTAAHWTQTTVADYIKIMTT